ncbi:MAG: hypothetical protein LBV21_06210 [Candidatus Adiutrix sp.]|jgi:hypothetical protein|nr:hypothetical protein [Candidatus Adiutrix sp.]
MKALYYGIEAQARKARDLYVGVNGKARMVVAGYIGVADKARLFWAIQADPSVMLPLLAASTFTFSARNNKYAVFLGTTTTATAYDYSLTRTTAPAPTAVADNKGSCVSFGQYAMFNVKADAVVNVYNEALTRSTLTMKAANGHKSSRIRTESHALFIGGSGSAIITAYNLMLTAVTVANHPYAASGISGSRMGSSAIVAGGYVSTNNYPPALYRYDDMLTRTALPSISQGRSHASSGTITTNDQDSHVIFAGGHVEMNSTATTDAYNSLLQRVTSENLSVSCTYIAPVSLGEKVLFAGGTLNRGTAQNVVAVYDNTLTRSSAPNLSQVRAYAGGVRIGKYAIIGGGGNGGEGGGTATKSMDVYDIELNHWTIQ